MQDVHVFIGMPLEGLFLATYEAVPAQKRALFVGKDETSLREIQYQDKKYVGRFVPAMSSITDLEMIEQNVFSVLKRLTPEFHFDETPLILFSFPYSESDV